MTEGSRMMRLHGRSVSRGTVAEGVMLVLALAAVALTLTGCLGYYSQAEVMHLQKMAENRAEAVELAEEIKGASDAVFAELEPGWRQELEDQFHSTSLTLASQGQLTPANVGKLNHRYLEASATLDLDIADRKSQFIQMMQKAANQAKGWDAEDAISKHRQVLDQEFSAKIAMTFTDLVGQATAAYAARGAARANETKPNETNPDAIIDGTGSVAVPQLTKKKKGGK